MMVNEEKKDMLVMNVKKKDISKKKEIETIKMNEFSKPKSIVLGGKKP